MATDLWLVRSGGRILGPYTKQQVAESIISRDITIHDEIASPLGYWSTIASSLEFRPVVDQLMNEFEDADELTRTSGLENTQTMTVTSHADDDEIDFNTDVIKEENLNKARQKLNDPLSHVKEAKKVDKPTTIRSYSQAPTVSTIKSNQSWTRQVWMVAVLLSLGVMAGVYFTRMKQAPKLQETHSTPKLSATDIASLAQSKLRTGQYEEALAQYQQAYKQEPANDSLLIYIGALLTRLSENSLSAKDFLTKASQLPAPDVRKRAFTSFALLSLKDENYDEAERFLNKALLVDENYFPAIINLAQVAAINGDVNQSRGLFVMAIESKKEPLMATFLSSFYEVQRFQKGENVDLELVNNMLDAIIASQTKYLQESLMLKLFLNYKQSDTKQIEASLLEILRVDPYLFNEFRWNLFVYNSNFSWSLLMPYCEEIVSGLSESAIKTSFLAVCLAKSGDSFKANNYAIKALTQSPNDAVILANMAYVKSMANLFREEGILLKKAVENNKNSDLALPYSMLARYCHIEGDKTCALKNSQTLLRIEPKNLLGLATLSVIYQYQGDLQKARELAIKGMAISDDYIPILKVSEAIDKGQ